MRFGVAKIQALQAEPVFRGHSHGDYLNQFSGVSTTRYLDHVMPRLAFVAKAFLITTGVEIALGDVLVYVRPGRSSVHGIKLCFAHKFYSRKRGDGSGPNGKGALVNVPTLDCRNHHIPRYICFKGVNNTGGVNFLCQGQGAHAIFLISQISLAKLRVTTTMNADIPRHALSSNCGLFSRVVLLIDRLWRSAAAQQPTDRSHQKL